MENLPMETKLLLKQKFIDNSFIFLQNITSSLKKDLQKNITQSTVDLVSCYICLEKVDDPLLCPKCHNFACRKCLKKYFGVQNKKKCGLCKQEIEYSKLQENKIIKELKNILSTDKTQKNAVDEFAKVIKEKQLYYQEQKNDIQNIINGLLDYQECLEKYKTGFNEYLLECSKLVDNTFKNYYENIQNLINSLFSYDGIYQKSITKYEEIYNKAKENYFNSENIKDFINQILYLEKKEMNDNHKLETKKFLLSPITFKPVFKNFSIAITKMLQKSFESSSFQFQSQNLGKCLLKIDYSELNKIYHCQLKVTTNKSDYEKCFLVKFCKKGNSAREFIMKTVKKNDLEYYFECDIEQKNLFSPNENSFNYYIEVLEMNTFNKENN